MSKLVEITKEVDLPEHDKVYCSTDAHLAELPQQILKGIPTKYSLAKQPD